MMTVKWLIPPDLVRTGAGSVIQQYFCMQQDRVPAAAALSATVAVNVRDVH